MTQVTSGLLNEELKKNSTSSHNESQGDKSMRRFKLRDRNPSLTWREISQNQGRTSFIIIMEKKDT